MTCLTQREINQHIAWMRSYLALMSEANWRDMKLRLERQLDQLQRSTGGQRTPVTELAGMGDAV